MIGTWTASRGTGLLSAGGKLVLTRARLLFEPMRTPKNVLLGPIAKMVGQGEAGEVVNAGINAAGTLDQWATPLSSIAHVEPIAESRLRVTLRSGESWEFGVQGGLYSLPGSNASTDARDQVIGTIESLIGTQLPAQPASSVAATAASQPDPLLEGRQRAIASGQEVTIADEPGAFVRVRATPDGWIHMRIGEIGARPADATAPPNLVGRWRIKNEALEFLDLHPAGSVSGQVWLFGGLPPLRVGSGEWWWSQSGSELATAISLPVAAGFDECPIAFHVAYPLRVTNIGPNVVSGKLVYGSEAEDWYLTRA